MENLTLVLLVVAFGGGVLATMWGSIVAFIFCGLLALVGNGVIAAGGDATILGLAFGPLFGPHIAFGGAVAAAAFAGKKGLIPSGGDVVSPLVKLKNPSVLIVGGLFGVLGQVIFAGLLMLGLGKLTNFDVVAVTVVISGIIARFAFGKTGIIGTKSEGRKYFIGSGDILFEVICGLGIGLVAAYTAMQTGLTSLPFAIAAFSLIILQMGTPFTATHHIANCAALAGFMSGNLFIGAAFGAIAALLGCFYASVFNSNCDTHIDPPACTIATLTLVIALMFG